MTNFPKFSAKIAKKYSKIPIMLNIMVGILKTCWIIKASVMCNPL